MKIRSEWIINPIKWFLTLDFRLQTLVIVHCTRCCYKFQWLSIFGTVYIRIHVNSKVKGQCEGMRLIINEPPPSWILKNWVLEYLGLYSAFQPKRRKENKKRNSETIELIRYCSVTSETSSLWNSWAPPMSTGNLSVEASK